MVESAVYHRSISLLEKANPIYWNLAMDMWELENGGKYDSSRSVNSEFGSYLYRSFIVQLCMLDLVDPSYEVFAP